MSLMMATMAAAATASGSSSPTATLLDQTVDATTGTSIVSGSVSPTSDCLLVVFCRMSRNEAANINVSATTLSNVGSWTDASIYSGDLSDGTIGVSYAKVTGAPGSGTITVSWNNGRTYRAMHVIQVEGHDTTSPVTQTKLTQEGSGSATHTGTFDASVDSNALVLAGITHHAAGVGDITEGAAFTKLAESAITRALHTEYDREGPADTFDWSGLKTTEARASAAIEIAAA